LPGVNIRFDCFVSACFTSAAAAAAATTTDKAAHCGALQHAEAARGGWP